MEPGIIMIIAIVAIGCATGLISSWMNHRYKDVVDSGRFNQLAEAFVEHKKDMQQRMQHLEAIIAEEPTEPDYTELEAPKSDSNLTNDLNEKEEIRS